MTILIIFVAALAVLNMTGAVAEDDSNFRRNARAAADQLMTMYDQSTGIWHDGNSPLWWNSANMLTAMIDLFRIDSHVNEKYGYMIATTYANAPAANPHATRKRSPGSLYTRKYARRSKSDLVQRLTSQDNQNQGFLNGFYDDEGWWALAWIDAYDLTGNINYLKTAQAIWTDMKGGETTPCGPGGIWWDRKKSNITSIANELFLATSAALALRSIPADQPKYTKAAISSINFFKSHNLIGANSLIVDGLDTNCKPMGTTFTYNQGVILGGLLDLAQVTGNSSFSSLAVRIANAAISNDSPLVTNGILHEPNNCEQTDTCGNDGDQFKGVFVRNLRKLHLAMPNDRWRDFLATNARSVWSRDRKGSAMLGPNWAGPYVGAGKAPAQCSALECVVAAEATQ